MGNENNNNKVLISLLVVFIIATFALGGYIIFSKTSTNNPTNENEPGNNVGDNGDKSNYISKVDSDKDWIYDATYEKDVTADSYSTVKTYYAKDIKVPFININSTAATKANEDIKVVLDTAIAAYNQGVNDKVTYVDECDYDSYKNDDIVSTIITLGIGATDTIYPDYYAYNFDLKTGNKLSYEDVYTKAGIKKSEIASKVETAINKVLENSYSGNPELDSLKQDSLNNYNTALNNDSLYYYLSENNKLNIVVKLAIPSGRGERNYIISVD